MQISGDFQNYLDIYKAQKMVLLILIIQSQEQHKKISKHILTQECLVLRK